MAESETARVTRIMAERDEAIRCQKIAIDRAEEWKRLAQTARAGALGEALTALEDAIATAIGHGRGDPVDWLVDVRDEIRRLRDAAVSPAPQSASVVAAERGEEEAG
jgi:hypothetical protein